MVGFIFHIMEVFILKFEVLMDVIKEVLDWAVKNESELKIVLTALLAVLAPLVFYVKGFIKPINEVFGLLGKRHGDKIARFLKKKLLGDSLKTNPRKMKTNKPQARKKRKKVRRKGT